MNKQEIEHKLEQARKDERAIGDNIIKLLEQLAEAEKPKLRHGDFGIGGGFPRLTLKSLQGQMFSAGTGCCSETDVNRQHPEPIFGNIFDLMNDWGEDLEEFKIKISCDMRTFIIEKSGWSLKDLYIGIKDDNAPESRKGVQLTLAEAEEIWRKLGQMIMTLKRKQS